MANPKPSVLTNEQLRRLCETLYGRPNFTRQLAEDLNISDQSVRNMLAGRNSFHAGHAASLVEVIDARQSATQQALTVLQHALKATPETA